MIQVQIIPVSTIIPTYNRTEVLAKTLQTIAIQNTQFTEIIIVDASENNLTQAMLATNMNGLQSKIIYQKAIQKGAAAQRNQAVAISTQSFVCFMDDDVYLEPFCVERLWNGIKNNESVGGINAMITNQQYHALGGLTKLICKLLHGNALGSYAGKCIGPAYNFLPEDNEALSEYVPVDWLNLGCTIYRKAALQNPPFQSHFTGYSMMEDLTLSLTVGKNYTLLNARTARIFHDSQPGDYKSNVTVLEKMELVNRHYVMTKVLDRTKLTDHLKLFLLELFFVFSLFQTIQGLKKMPKVMWGKLLGIKHILFHV